MPPEIVHTMSDVEVSQIATEPEESKARRQKLKSQLSALQSALKTCRRHAPHEDVSESGETGGDASADGEVSEDGWKENPLTKVSAQNLNCKRISH